LFSKNVKKSFVKIEHTTTTNNAEKYITTQIQVKRCKKASSAIIDKLTTLPKLNALSMLYYLHNQQHNGCLNEKNNNKQIDIKTL